MTNAVQTSAKTWRVERTGNNGRILVLGRYEESVGRFVETARLVLSADKVLALISNLADPVLDRP